MKENFAVSLQFVLKWEGGKDDDPDDPGGRTFEGITQKEYDAWCSLKSLPHGDVWQCPQITVTDIYRASYWNPYGDSLPAGIDLMFFDCAVNEGPREAVLFLQRALGVKVDGHFGVVTAARLKENTNTAALVRYMSAARGQHYRSLPIRNRRLAKFLKGWLNRNADCLENALKLIPEGT